jgi:RimJ/RimL family protein N-acetyltransferase
VSTAIARTARLLLRPFTLDDAEFAFELVNDPAWIANIGDRNVRSLDDARRYVGRNMDMYERHGFGMWVTAINETGEAIGTCGLVKREGLDGPDIGFAFLERHRNRGYAFEAATAVMSHARDPLGFERVAAIVSPANVASIRLLEKIGLRFERPIRLPGDGEEISLYSGPTG